MLMTDSVRYRIDKDDADDMRKLALSLVDQTRSMHRLDKAFREWISTAAMLHEVGNYVNPAGRHRHTRYIISHSELFGFTALQRAIIATIARFEDHSEPHLRDRLI